MDEFINAAVELIAAYQNFYIASRAYDEANDATGEALLRVLELRPESGSDIDAGMYAALERMGLTEGDQVYEAVIAGLRLSNAELN